MISAFFGDRFGYSPNISGFTPGRVNLIGEHTDYNGGLVLPAAIPLGISLAVGLREDDQIRVSSALYEHIYVGRIGDKAQSHWADYVIGTIHKANNLGLLSTGADIAIQSDLPSGAGLSSSAALTVGLLKLCRDLGSHPMSELEIAKQAQTIENEFIGVPCGIMDQMAVALSPPGQALSLDTFTLDFKLIEIPGNVHMAVIHSGIYRQLSEGRYKVRKEECDIIKKRLGRQDICRMTDTEYSNLSDLPATIQNRARHCWSEHRRTKSASLALKSNDMKLFGSLMTESHQSMRDDFEITLPEIDKLTEDAVKFGAYGARMTGGGFGGCMVACVDETILDEWKSRVLKQHPNAFYVC